MSCFSDVVVIKYATAFLRDLILHQVKKSLVRFGVISADRHLQAEMYKIGFPQQHFFKKQI